MRSLLFVVLLGHTFFLHASVIPRSVTSQYGFIENKGQIIDQNNQLNPAVLYLYNGKGLHVQLRKNGFSYEVIKTVATPKQRTETSLPEPLKQDSLNYTHHVHRIDISFGGGNPRCKITPFEAAADYVNYYTVGTPEEGVTKVRHYKKVVYENVYPSIDVEFLVGERFKYNFIVRPGGNIHDIGLRVDGAETSLNEHAHIVIKTAYGSIEESIPESFYTNVQGQRVSVLASFNQISEHFFGMAVSNYDESKTLVIDPAPWATYIGGAGQDLSRAITTDAGHNALVCGYTLSVFAIATAGAHQTTLAGAADAFVAKYAPSGSLLWATYYGGIQHDHAHAIAARPSGNLVTGGRTQSSAGIATINGYDTSFGGDVSLGYYDAFVTEFDPAGIRVWASYYGSTGSESAQAVAIDNSGSIFLGGSTNSMTGFASPGAFRSVWIGWATSTDAFIVKFNPDGTRHWATYIGGIYDEGLNALVPDDSGNVYFCGVTRSDTAVATAGAHQTTIGGDYDAFMGKFSGAGQRLWTTFYGGTGADYGQGLARDPGGMIYICGSAASTTNISTPGSYQPTGPGGYVAKFTSQGVRIWGTYYVGPPTAMSLDPSGNIILGGHTTSVTGVATSGAHQTSHVGNPILTNAFLAKFTSAGSRVWGTYYGAATTQVYNGGLSCDAAGNIFLTGYVTASATGIATAWGQQPAYGGGSEDGFVAVFSPVGGLIIKNDTITGAQSICKGILPSGLVGSTPNGGTGLFKYQWWSSTVSATSGFVPAGGSDSLQSYSPGPMMVSTWYKRVVTSGGAEHTSNAVLVTVKLSSAFSVNKSEQCYIGHSFQFADVSTISTGTYTRKWSFGAGSSDTSSAANPVKVYSASGTYQVKLVLTSTNGCKDSMTNFVVVGVNPLMGFTINSLTEQCVNGNSFSFTDTSSISNGTLARKWNFGTSANDTSTLASPLKVFAGSGIFRVTLTQSTAGCTDTISKIIVVFPKPTVAFSVNKYNQCVAGNAFLFYDSSSISSGSMLRIWNLGTSDTSGLPNPSKTYFIAGNYLINLTQVSNNGCRDSVSKVISVYPAPGVGFTINNGKQCLSGNQFLFTDTSVAVTGALSRKWYFGGGTSDTSSAGAVSKIYPLSGQYPVKLIVATVNGCKDSLLKTVDVFPQPKAGFRISNPSQCEVSNNFTFTDTSKIATGALKRQWNFGSGAYDTSGLLPATKSYSAAGTYQVKLISISGEGCSDSTSKAVTVNPGPVIGFEINQPQQCFTGNLFILTDTSSIASGTLSRIWHPGDSTTSGLISMAKSFINPGNYLVKLVVTSDKACSDSSTKLVTVHPHPVAGFTQNYLERCLTGNSFSFDDTSATAVTRVWDLGDLTTSISDTLSKTYAMSGQFNVKLKVTDANNCSDSISRMITVKPNPVKPVITALSNSQLQSSAAAGYQWYLNAGAISGAISQTLSLTTSGTYLVKADSTNGCSSLSDPFFASHVGHEKLLSTRDISIYPNPTTGSIRILAEEVIIQVTIFDMAGRVVYEMKVAAQSPVLDLSAFTNGIYHARIISENGSFDAGIILVK